MDTDHTEKPITKKMGNQTIDALSLEETTQIIHDLHIHQAELEAINEDFHMTEAEMAIIKRDYADLFDVTPIGLFIFGEDGIVKNVNQIAAAMLEIDRKHLEGKPFLAFLEAESVPVFYDHLRKAVSTKQRQIFEVRIRKLTAGMFPAECDLMPIYDENDKFIHFRAVITNATDRKITTEAMIKRKLL